MSVSSPKTNMIKLNTFAFQYRVKRSFHKLISHIDKNYLILSTNLFLVINFINLTKFLLKEMKFFSCNNQIIWLEIFLRL